MKILFIISLLVSSQISLAEAPKSQDYWKLYENYASSNVAKYHDVLFSLQKGDIEEAKAKILRYQKEEVSALNKLAEHHQLSATSQEIIRLVNDYQSPPEK